MSDAETTEDRQSITDREYRRDCQFGRLYMVGNLLWFTPAAIAFYFCWNAAEKRGWQFWMPLADF
jgi:hypothetical protein